MSRISITALFISSAIYSSAKKTLESGPIGGEAFKKTIVSMILRLGIFSLVLFCSCSSVPKTSYQDKGLSFKITQDFRIGKSNTFKKNQATFISINSRDNDVYAKFSVVWLPCHSDLDWEIQNYVNGLNSIYASDMRNNPVYSEVRPTKFGSNEARQIDYIVPKDGPRVGSYTVFYCDNLTVIIGQHSSENAQPMIERCRKMIESTYSCSQTAQ